MLLCGALSAFAMGTFTSCNDDDDLETRVGVLETALNDLQAQINKALTVGASITNVAEENGTTVLTLSNGEKISIKAGGGAVSVTMTDTHAEIKVNDETYKIPLGASVSSLIYSPDYEDGLVLISDGSGAEVKLLPRPALDNINGAEFTVAESHQLLTRAGDGDDFKVSSAELKDGFIVVKLLCINEDVKGQKHAVSIQMKMNGTVIGSNYFTVSVDNGFSFASEAIDSNIKVTAAGATLDEATNAYSFTVNGLDIAKGMDFKTVFEGLADGDFFAIAPAGKQSGDAADRQAMLAKSLSSDGTFKFAERPGTSFGDTGFLVQVKRGETVVAKTYVKINDELANVAFTPFPGVFEAEWGGREKNLELGAQRIDIQKAFTNYEEDITIIHGCPEFFSNWADGQGSVEVNGVPVLYNNGAKMVLDELGQAYAPEDLCRGIFWFYRGLSIRLPEDMAPYTDEFGTEWTSGGEGYGDFVNGNDMWMGQSWDYIRDPVGFYPQTAQYLGLQMDEKTGDLITPSSYTGWGFRFAISCGYEYLYGCKNVTSGSADAQNDQVGMLFFNRRLSPEGATMPLSDK